MSRPEGAPTAASGPRVRPGDLPLLYVLLGLNIALIVILPLGALSLQPLIERLVSTGRMPSGSIWGLGAAWLVVEIGFLWRASRVWTRIRAVRPPAARS